MSKSQSIVLFTFNSKILFHKHLIYKIPKPLVYKISCNDLYNALIEKTTWLKSTPDHYLLIFLFFVVLCGQVTILPPGGEKSVSFVCLFVSLRFSFQFGRLWCHLNVVLYN